MVNASNDSKPPLLHRLKVKVGGWFGYQWVPENHLRVIFRDEMYYESRGPGFVRVDGFRERADVMVDTAPQFATLDFVDLPTRQGAQLGLRIYLGYAFDPRKTRREIALQLVKLEQEIFRAIMHRYVRWALLRIVVVYNAEDIARGIVFAEIEHKLEEMLPLRLEILGMKLFKGVQVQGVIVSDLLQARFENVTQRGVNIKALKDFQPTQIAQALATEVVEKLGAQSGEGQYVNLGDAFNALKSAPALPAEPPVITIDHEPLNAPPAPDHSDPPPAKPPPFRGSYLDDDTC